MLIFLNAFTVILLPQCPVFLMHKNRKDAKYFKARIPYNATIDQSELNMCILFVYFLWQLLWLLFNDAYFF